MVTTLISLWTLSLLPAKQEGPSITILPSIITSGEKWEELRNNLVKRTNEQLVKVFANRGFKVIEGESVKSKITELKLDFSDEENHRKDNLYAVGEGMQSDYVVFFVITNNTQRTKTNVFTQVREGEVTAKYWLLDVKKREAIFSAKSETAKARPSTDFGIGTKGSDQQLTAADRVVPAALKDFLAKYPEIKKQT